MSTDWIKHDGKGYPGFPIGTKLIVKYSAYMDNPCPMTIQGDNLEAMEVIWGWRAFDSSLDIIEYRVVS